MPDLVDRVRALLQLAAGSSLSSSVENIVLAQVPRIYLSGRTTYGKKSGTTTTTATTNVGSIAQPDELCIVHWTFVVGCRNFQLCKEV